MDIKIYRHANTFYFLSIIIPWTLWISTGYLSHYRNENAILIGVGSLLGLLAPLIIALLFILPDKVLRDDFFGRLFGIGSISSKYLSVAFLLMPFSILIAQVISIFFGYSTEQFQFRDGYTFSSGILPVWVILIMAPIIEELAWHSYGTDCLRSRFNLLTTSIIFALIWGIWHLPLSFIKDYYHSNLVESGLLYSINFFLSLFPFVLIMNWLYYKTNRNISVTITFHLSAGYFNELFATDPMSKVIQTGLLTVFATNLITKDKTFFFNPKYNLK